jgi:hypothetical protein
MGNYKKSGCHECVHGESKWEFIDGKHTLIERKCKLGFNDKIIKWWSNNGYKTQNDTMDLMDCHEYHESTKRLIDMNDIASEILELLKKENE